MDRKIPVNIETADKNDIYRYLQRGTNRSLELYREENDTGGIIRRSILRAHRIRSSNGVARVLYEGVILLNQQTEQQDIKGMMNLYRYHVNDIEGYEAFDMHFNNGIIAGQRTLGEYACAMYSEQHKGIIITNNGGRMNPDRNHQIREEVTPHYLELNRFDERFHAQVELFAAAVSAVQFTETQKDLTHIDIALRNRDSVILDPSQQEEPKSIDPESPDALLEFSKLNKREKRQVTMLSIGGHENVKRQLSEIMAMYRHPEAFTKWGVDRPNGVLLVGDSGTGKSMMVEALANELEAEVIAVTSDKIYAKYVGESEGNMQKIFETARAAEKLTILLFEDITGIITTPREGSEITSQKVSTVFTEEMKRLHKETDKVLVVATTSRIDQLDSPILSESQFGVRLSMEKPDENARREIFIIKMTELDTDLSYDDFKPIDIDSINTGELARTTDGWTGGKITELFRRAKLRKAIAEKSGATSTPICHHDLVQLISELRH